MTSINKFIYFLGIIFLLEFSCNGIFVPDPYDPRMPRYTEEGNNYGGAMLNGKLWISENVLPPCQNCNAQIHCDTAEDKFEIDLAGILEGGIGRIHFHLTGIDINNVSDFDLFESKKFQFNAAENYISFNEYYADTVKVKCKDLSGQLYLKHVKVDSMRKRVILSGTFGSSCNHTGCVHCELAYGRFDYLFILNENLFFY